MLKEITRLVPIFIAKVQMHAEGPSILNPGRVFMIIFM